MLNASVTEKMKREKSSVRYTIYQVTMCIVHFVLCRVVFRVAPYYHKCQTIQLSFFFVFSCPSNRYFTMILEFNKPFLWLLHFSFLFSYLPFFNVNICICVFFGSATTAPPPLPLEMNIVLTISSRSV